MWKLTLRPLKQHNLVVKVSRMEVTSLGPSQLPSNQVHSIANLDSIEQSIENKREWEFIYKKDTADYLKSTKKHQKTVDNTNLDTLINRV